MTTTAIQKKLKKVNDLFSDEDSINLELPEMGEVWRRKLEAYDDAGLLTQKEQCIMEMRCEQVKKLGFEEVTVEQCIEMIMGEPHTDIRENDRRTVCEWYYNHHIDELGTSSNWGGVPDVYVRKDSGEKFWKPPFVKKEIWAAKADKLNELQREIPYGVALRIAELKKAKVFNAFSVVAPMEAFKDRTEIDPIVIGEIWEFPLENGVYNRSGKEKCFLVAQW